MARFQPSIGSSSSSEEEEEEEDEEEEEESDESDLEEPISSPLGSEEGGGGSAVPGGGGRDENQSQFSVLEVVVTALRKSFVPCSVGAVAGDDDAPCPSGSPSSIDISWPTEVRHVAHVTFDRFDGFLGLPVELLHELPRRVPSASANVFGVSAQSMQCSYDNKGNSVPTILLSMQRHLYSLGGLQAEGIFRINAENSREVYVRDQLNKGIVPHGVEMHCLAGLIKAWFRELPTGVLDSLTPDRVMHCNTEEECSLLVKTLPQTEAALLDWSINLMADVVENEHHNKMNSRNIAMVFAPNMTQMADPLTALIHAVQVMNLLKTLIMKTLREREEIYAETRAFHSCSDSPSSKDESREKNSSGLCVWDGAAISKFLFSAEHPMDQTDVDQESFRSFEKRSEAEADDDIHGLMISGKTDLDAIQDNHPKIKHDNEDAEGVLRKLSFSEAVRKVCRHSILQLSKRVKKEGPPEDGREVWT